MTGAEPTTVRGLRAASLGSGSEDVYVGVQHPVGTDLPTAVGDLSGGPDDLDKEPMPLDRSALEARVAKYMAQRPLEQPTPVGMTASAPAMRTSKRSFK
jgi:hypothetical protein